MEFDLLASSFVCYRCEFRRECKAEEEDRGRAGGLSHFDTPPRRMSSALGAGLSCAVVAGIAGKEKSKGVVG